MFVKKIKKLSPLLIIIAAISIALVLTSKKEPIAKSNNTSQRELPLVEVVQVHYQSKILTILSQGLVQPNQETALTSEVSGIISFVSERFKVGAFFHKDEVLLRIDPIDYQVAVKKAQALLAQKQAILSQETALSIQAKKQWQDEVNPTALALREPFLAEAKALVSSAEADLQRAEIKLQRTEFKAPYDGIVLNETVGLGQYLNVGTSVGDIFSVASAEIRLPVTDNQLALLDLPELSQEGLHQTAEKDCAVNAIIINRYKNKRHQREAEVCRAEAVIDMVNRVNYLIAKVNDPYNLYQKNGVNASLSPLKNGSFVEAKIPSKVLNNIVAVPRYLLRENNQILVIDDESRIAFRTVNIVHSDEQYLYINSGLNEGENICLTSIDFPVEGEQVKISTATNSSNSPVNSSENSSESSSSTNQELTQ